MVVKAESEQGRRCILRKRRPGQSPAEEALKREMMNETKAVRISSLKYADEFSLRLRWKNGKTMSVDLQEPVSRLKGMRPLRNKAVSAQASKGEGGHSVVWPGDIDMGADRLWEMTQDRTAATTLQRD